jgi:hypothetical protein
MRLSELISAVRHRVNDSGSKYNTDLDITAWLNRHQRSLMRRKVEADTSYCDQKLDILASDTTRVEQIYSDTWRYYLPSWVYRVRRVSAMNGSQIQRDLRVDEWGHSSTRSIDIRDTQARDLRLGVAKVPAIMRPLKVIANGTTIDEIIVPIADASYPYETEPGCMLGAQLELTTRETGRDPRCGPSIVIQQTQTLVGSTPAWNLKVRPSLSALTEIDDTIEMHSEIEDVHATYLINLVALDIFHQKQNMTAVMNLRQEIVTSERAFIVGLQPRTDGLLNTMNQGFNQSAFDDRDMDPWSLWWS